MTIFGVRRKKDMRDEKQNFMPVSFAIFVTENYLLIEMRESKKVSKNRFKQIESESIIW